MVEISTEGIELEVFEKCEFQYFRSKEIQLAFSNHQLSDASNIQKLLNLPVELNMSMETLMDEMKIIVVENHDFENGDLSFLRALFGNLDYRVSDARKKSSSFESNNVPQVESCPLRP